MNPVDAFLTFTAASYFLVAALPEPVTKDIRPRSVERFLMALSGVALSVNLLLDIPLLWLVYGVWWTLAAVFSYLGYSRWNVLWREDVSDAAQMVMFLWDALIAVCCLGKF